MMPKEERAEGLGVCASQGLGKSRISIWGGLESSGLLSSSLLRASYLAFCRVFALAQPQSLLQRVDKAKTQQVQFSWHGAAFLEESDHLLNGHLLHSHYKVQKPGQGEKSVLFSKPE